MLYCDSGVEIINDLSYFFNKLNEQDFIFFELPMLNKNWTKKDCFVLMNVDQEKYWNSTMFVAGIMFLKKSQQSIDFIKEWLFYAQDENILTDVINLPNDPSFKAHRHDQSILTNLIIKYNYGIYAEKYDTLLKYFNIHRRRSTPIVRKIQLKIKYLKNKLLR